MMKQTFLTVILVALLGGFLFGQEQRRDDVPQDPQLAVFPEKIAFMKTFVYQVKPRVENLTSEQRAARNFLAHMEKQLVKIQVVKTGGVKREMQHFDNGTALEVWESGGFTFSINSLKPNQIIVFSSGMLAHPESAPADQGNFDELNWINKGNYRGTQDQQGVVCLVYKAGDQVAWLDKKSHLPICFQSSKVKITYTYQAVPSQNLVLPEKFSKKLEAVQRAWRGQCN